MVSLDGYWIALNVKGFHIMFIFNLNVVFTMKFLKMTPIRVRFSLGLLSEAGFPGEQFAPAWFLNFIGAAEV
jgi:hypothetical protein